MISDQQIREKASGIIAALSQLMPNQRLSAPNEDFVQDYNALRALTAKLHSDLETILPPIVRTAETHYGTFIANCTYAEIHSYCQQIFNLIKT